jgi:hypothetical protein
MFVGHIGVGLALKKAEPKLNLGAIVFASLLLDVLLGIFILTGLETVIVPEDYAQLHYLYFRFPYSHSFLASLIWSLIALGVTYALCNRETRPAKLVSSLTIAAAVMLHWICDWIEHPPQLPIANSESALLGFGLWNNLPLALTLEVLLVAIGVFLYFKASKRIGRKTRRAVIGFIILLTSVAVIGQATVTQVPEPNALAISILIQALVVSALACWVDREPTSAQ